MHVSAIKGRQLRQPEAEANANDDSTMVISNHRICNMKTSSRSSELTSDGNGKFLMSWRRRRRRSNKSSNNIAAASRNYDNCNYSTTNDFNKINKLLLITYMLLITAATICQSAAQSPSSLNGGGGGGGGGIGGGGGSGSNGASPLSAFLKSGGASYNQQLPQQQLFAMLTRNGVGSSGSGSLPGAGGGGNRGYSNARQHFMALSEDDSDADVDEEDMAALHYPLAASHPPAGGQGYSSIQSGSLETSGFVSDDGGQYEQAQKALEAAAAAAKANNKYNIDCPKDCKCLNVLFDCDKLHLERVPVLPSYVQTL